MVQYQEVQHQIVGYWYCARLIEQYYKSTTFNSAIVNSATSNSATSNNQIVQR